MRPYCPGIPGLPRKCAFDILPGGHSPIAIIQRGSVRERVWAGHRMMGVSIFSTGTFI